MPMFPITIVFEVEAETEEEAHVIVTDMLAPVLSVDALLPKTPDLETESREGSERATGEDPLLGMPGHDPVKKAKPNRGRRRG